MKALGYLYRNGRSTVGEVADGLGLAMPTASELVDKLAERGLIERGVNPDNRRQVHVWLTEEAMAYGREVHALRRAQIRQVFDALKPNERAIFVRGLRSLAEAVAPPPAVSSSPELATPAKAELVGTA
jgi:DNA-binding MarR family transcriptional regulator